VIEAGYPFRHRREISGAILDTFLVVRKHMQIYTRRRKMTILSRRRGFRQRPRIWRK